MSQITDKIRASRNQITDKLKAVFRPIVKLLSFFGGWIIPVLLIILIVLPIILISLRSNQREDVFPEAVNVQKGDLIKSIKATGSIEPSYSYEVKVYQNAKITELLAKKGDFVKKDQILAKIEFINGTKLRDTDILNQLSTNAQDNQNLSGSTQDALKVAQATLTQLSTQINNRNADLEDLNKKISDKQTENVTKKETYIKERDDYQRQYDNLETIKYLYDSLKAYNDELTAKRDQLQTFDITSQTKKIKDQITQQELARNNAQLIRNSATCTLGSPQYNQVSCDQATNSYNAAQQSINDLNAQLTQIKPVDSGAKSRLENDINDLENKIKALQSKPEYSGAQTRNPPFTDQNYTAIIEAQKADIKKEIETRKTQIKAIDDSKEIDTLTDQKKSLERTKAELEASKNTQTANLNQNTNNLKRQQNSNLTQNENLQLKLADTKADIKDQEETKTLKAKKDGILADIKTEQDLEIAAGQTQFKVFSPDYRLKFKVSADTRAKLEIGLPVNILNESFKSIKGATISFASLTPLDSVNKNDTPEYEIFVDLPKTDGINFVTGQSADIEVILQKLENVLYVPRNAVDDNKVYLGFDEGKSGLVKVYGRFEERQVKTGLDAGSNIQIIEGLSENDKVFPVFPRTEEDKTKLQKQFRKN